VIGNSGLPFADWLDSARDQGDPARFGLYFVGTFDRRITFYSQQVRALRLAHALDATGLIQSTHTTAVVGAGAAGVTIAVALAALGHDVTLYDPAIKVLQLQSASSRLQDQLTIAKARWTSRYSIPSSAWAEICP
jgi:hypothetical protein